MSCYSPCVNTKRVLQPDSTEPRCELSMANADTGTTDELEEFEKGI